MKQERARRLIIKLAWLLIMQLIEPFMKNSCDHCSSYDLSNAPAVPNRGSFLDWKGTLTMQGKILL